MESVRNTNPKMVPTRDKACRSIGPVMYNPCGDYACDEFYRLCWMHCMVEKNRGSAQSEGEKQREIKMEK